MALISTGNTLSAEVLQPGFVFQSDGFGLVTGSATYKIDWTVASTMTVRGQAFPQYPYTYTKAHKSSQSWDNLEVKTIKVDYVGIDPTINGGSMTNANTSVANGLTAENITSHPNFFTAATGYGGVPLAGLPTDFPFDTYNDSTLGPLVNAKNVDTGEIVAVPSSQGYNGACFETGKGGRFIGFVDPEVPDLYGKTQYLSRTTTYSGVIYVDDASYVQALYALLGTATSSDSWGIFKLIPAWGPVGTGDFGNQNLLSQVNVEEYGLLYKVMYEIRYSKEGWPLDVYINI